MAHGPPGLAVIPGTCPWRELTSVTDRQYGRCSVTAQSAWEKPVASVVAAWVCRDFRQVAPVRRCGAGGIFSAPGTRPVVDALSR